jgi:EAL domain-containing protein (putative c-di-GMP-specific phosphodiesterase class I)
MPSDFIPLAEQSGLIHDIGSWALEQACRDACDWPAIAVAVNVSPIQFEKLDFAERCEDIVHRTGLAWSRLELELTETALLTAEDAVLQAMQRLIAQGATFALDDFGTGYSSLTYLRRFPFGKVKIDRSFTENVDSAVEATIVHAVTSIGRSLGLKIVAEGVQTIAQQRFMAAAGAHALQGYLFGEPMTKVDIARRLEAEAQAPARRSAAF